VELAERLSRSETAETVRILTDLVISGAASACNEQVALAGPRNTVRKLTPDEVTTLVERYQGGATVYVLAAEFKIGRETVSRHLRRQGVRLRLDGLDDRQIEEAAVLYAGGWSLARVGKHLGVTGNTVRAALLTRGVQTRDCQGRER
jgi:DNA-directed RNA polymerase specialized sigma24 family protein